MAYRRRGRAGKRRSSAYKKRMRERIGIRM